MQIHYQADPKQWRTAVEGYRDTMATAMRAAMTEVADKLKKDARGRIAAAGLSRRWQNAFRVYVFPKEPDDTVNVTVRGLHLISYANVFERGATITGKRLLWLPLPTAPAKIDGKRTTPKAFVQSIGPLHPITRPGKPPLLAASLTRDLKSGRRATVAQLRTGARNARRQQARSAFGGRIGRRVVSVPMFFGVPAVHIAARMNVSGAYEQARAAVGAAYVKAVQRQLRGAR